MFLERGPDTLAILFFEKYGSFFNNLFVSILNNKLPTIIGAGDNRLPIT